MTLSSKSTRCLILLELQMVSVEFTIKSKRIIYLHNLLTSNSSSLARNVFIRQWEEPIKGDFASLVKQDLKDFQIDLSLDDIQNYSKVKFKTIVKKACDSVFFSKLLEEKCKLSKGKEIVYVDFEVQPYLRSGSNLSPDDSCKILKCRIRDLDVRENFSHAYEDTKCPFPLCKSPENQLHLAICEFYPERSVISNGLKYADLFKSDIEKQFQIMNILIKRIAIRNEIFPAQAQSGGWPVDPRKKERFINRSTNRSTSRQTLSLVIRGQRRSSKKTIKTRQKSMRNKNK